MLTPEELQEESYWDDAWTSLITYKNIRGKHMYKFTLGEGQAEESIGEWIVEETIAGDAERVLVKATKDGVSKKMWVVRKDLQPYVAEVVEETDPEVDADIDSDAT
jgi:hypothetical protein